MSRDSENLDAPIRRESSPLITKQDLAGSNHSDSGFFELLPYFEKSQHFVMKKVMVQRNYPKFSLCHNSLKVLHNGIPF